MIESLLVRHLWVAILIWVVLYSLDYYQTLRGAQLYRRHAQQYFEFEGSYELNPRFQGDVDQGRRVSLRFMLALILASLLIVLLWVTAVLRLGWYFAYLFAVGLLFGAELAVNARHFQNIRVFHYLGRNPQDVSGHVRYTRRFIYRQSSQQFAGFGGLFFVVFLFTGSGLFLGGCLACLVLALSHLRMASKVPHPGPTAPTAIG